MFRYLSLRSLILLALSFFLTTLGSLKLPCSRFNELQRVLCRDNDHLPIALRRLFTNPDIFSFYSPVLWKNNRQKGDACVIYVVYVYVYIRIHLRVQEANEITLKFS